MRGPSEGGLGGQDTPDGFPASGRNAYPPRANAFFADGDIKDYNTLGIKVCLCTCVGMDTFFKRMYLVIINLQSVRDKNRFLLEHQNKCVHKGASGDHEK